MDKSPDAFRTISEVADWLGTPTHVLRFWESRFGQVKPVKRAGGRRYYRPADMALLGGIKKLLHDDGLTIRGVQKILREEGVRHVSSFSAPVDGLDIEPPEPQPAPDNVVSLGASDPAPVAEPPVQAEAAPAPPQPNPEPAPTPTAAEAPAPQPPSDDTVAPEQGDESPATDDHIPAFLRAPLGSPATTADPEPEPEGAPQDLAAAEITALEEAVERRGRLIDENADLELRGLGPRSGGHEEGRGEHAGKESRTSKRGGKSHGSSPNEVE